MSDCLDDQTVVDLVEGRADPATRARIEAHASNCDTCRGLLSALARDDKVITPAAIAETLPEPAPRPSTSKLEVGEKIGRYLVKRMLGAGGMGMVYAAHDPELDRGVAIKLLRPDVASSEAQERMQNRLKREAQAMAQLAHPNVVAVYDVGTFGDRIFVAMEYIDGVTLETWLAAKPRTHAEILDAFVAAGRGLAAAHAEGLVHRDFKPENCVVGDDGRIRVLDFGLALAVGEGPARTPLPQIIARAVAAAGASAPLDLTRTGTVVGTPYYMSPEQYRGEDSDARTDQFSFCVALYSALYDQRPFRGQTFEALAEAVLSGAVVPPPAKSRVAPHVRAVIARGMAHEPEARFPSMDALLAALTASPKPGKLRWIVPSALGVVGLGVGAVAIFARAPTVAPPPSVGCEDLAAQIGEAWSPQRTDEIRAALATAAPGLDESHAKLVALGDGYAKSLEAARAAACVPGARREASAVLACLSIRARSLGEVTVLLAGDVSQDYAASSLRAMHGLPSVASCAIAEEPLSSERRDMRRATELRQRAAEVEVQLGFGDVDRATKSIAPIVVDAARRDPTVFAEVSDLAARIADARTNVMPSFGGIGPTNDTITRQLDTTKLLGDARATVAIRTRMLVDRVLHLMRIGRYSEAWWSRSETLEALAVAEAASAMLPREIAALRGALLARYAEIETTVHHVEDAERDLADAAIAIGDDPLARARVLVIRAKLARSLAHEDDARARIGEAIELLAATFGPNHPEVGAAIEQLGDFARAAALYEKAFGLANRWRAAALVAQADAMVSSDRAAAIKLYEESIEIDELRGYRDAVAMTTQLKLARAYAPLDLEKAYRAFSRPYRPSTTPPPPSRATYRPISVAYGEVMVRAQIQLDLGFARLGLPPEPPGPAPIPDATTLLKNARAATLQYPPPGSSTTIEGFAFANPWRENYIGGEADLGLGDHDKAIAELAIAKATVASNDATVAAIDAAYGRALVDGKRDIAKGRALVIAAWPHMQDDPDLVWARDRTRKWMTAHGIP